ncbi:MAG TPA: PLP-dependent aminotransferase family protein [Alphaproteobacteria bacterium]|nr:PLP-dependent aminotransferase family protein [Alphaproteobacteria bacterium]
MTIWLPDLENNRGPRYLAIAEALQEDLSRGRLQPGVRLPTHRELAYRLGVTVGTVSRAYLEAERRGLIVGEVGRGTFVRGQNADGAHVGDVANPLPIDLTRNQPATAAAASALAATLAHLSRQNDLERLLVYRDERGLPTHREAAADWLAQTGIEADAERIAITCGTQHAFHATLLAMTQPGDTLLVEALTFPGLKALASRLGLRLQSIAIDRDGLIVDSLEAACREGKPRALFTMPTLHNPTTATLPATRRRAVAEIARRHDLLIVEDDIYGFLLEDHPGPIANFAPERTFYVTSVSKSMAAGLRLGFIAAPAEHSARIAAAIRNSVWMAPPLVAEIVTRWIRDGTAHRLAEACRQNVRRRQVRAMEILSGYDVETHPSSFHLWLHLPEPWRWADFCAAAENRGVRITPPDVFVADRAAAPHAVRVGLSAVESDARFESGLARLAELLASPSEPRLSVV